MALSYGNQLIFARDFAAYSGMSGNVILAWCLQEQPPGSPATPGGNNWLNIQYTDSGPNSEYYRIAGMSPADAARASVIWMNENQGTITASKGKSEYDQAAAIVNSGWATSKYGGIEKFYGVVKDVASSKLEATPAAPKTAAATMNVKVSGEPTDRSHKIHTTGQGLGAKGSQFNGHTQAMRNLRNRHTPIKIR
jgi:hypothetical protein